MAPKSHILRIARTDVSNQYVFLNITPTGSSPLDLKLIATESDHLYHATVKERSVKSLQAERYDGTLDDLKGVLKHVLLQQQQQPSSSSNIPAIADLEVVAAIADDILTITFRKNISGIKLSIGAIDAILDDAVEVNFLDWTDTAVIATDELREQCHSLQDSVREYRDQVAKLSAQLDDLVKAKKAQEEELLKKFAALLNAKKSKIRDQQRLLAGAKIDPEAAGVASSRRAVPGRRKAGVSRSGKRKAGQDEDDDEMVDFKAEKDDSTVTDDEGIDEARPDTPPRPGVDDDNGDEDQEDFAAATPPSRWAASTSKEKDHAMAAAGGDLELPPPPVLPFRKKAADITAGEESWTDDDDDEL